MADLTDRVVLVTGGGTGIGKAIAHRLARENAAVVVNGRREAPLVETVEAIHASGGLAVEAPGDITNEEEVERVVMTAVGAFGRLDSVVNNAGFALRDRALDQMTPDEWRQQMNVNLDAVWSVTRRALEEMRRCGEGSILHVASNLGVVGLGGMSAYVAAKGAVLSLTRAMALELGPEGIRVNALCPGLVHTPMTGSESGFEERKAFYEGHSALGRIGEPQDVAGAAAFLLGPEASWITGQSIVVDGGYTIQ